MKSIIEQKLTNASIGTGFPLALQTSPLRGRYVFLGYEQNVRDKFKIRVC